MIPSAMWIEMTRFHISQHKKWTPFATIGILILVSIGNILYAHLLGGMANGDWRTGLAAICWLAYVLYSSYF